VVPGTEEAGVDGVHGGGNRREGKKNGR
jgi:hypothetical protein